MDVNAACSGFVYASQIADNMIDENFTKSNLVALVVPKNDDYRVEAAMIK